MCKCLLYKSAYLLLNLPWLHRHALLCSCIIKYKLIKFYLCCYMLHQRMTHSLIFNFSKFYTISSKFHLLITSSDIFKLTILVISCKVTCSIYLYLFSINYILAEHLLSQFRLIPISLCNLRTCKTQLTCNSLRKKISVNVTN